MKNLQNFGVQELSAKEIRETQGGAWPWYVWVGVSQFAYDAIKGMRDGLREAVKEETQN